jgi:type IV secretion system protein TrbL
MAGCNFGDLGCVAGEAANSVFGGFVEGFYDGAVELAKLVGTWWMEVPPPSLASAALANLQQDLSWFVWIFAVIGFLFGLVRLLVTEDVRSGVVNLVKPIVNLVLATGVYMLAVPILLEAGDATSRWLLDRSTDGNAAFDTLVPPQAALAGNNGVAFVVYLLMLLGAAVNFLFMVFRNLMLLILMAFIALLAAASGTEAGAQAWRKANGFLIALLLFKPVAAGIYALGFRMMVDDADLTQTSDLAAGLVSALMGLLILVLAALALPMLIKFVSPAAAAGAGAFSGGAALAGAAGVAAGVAVLAGGAGAGGGTARAGGGPAMASGSGGAPGGGAGMAQAAAGMAAGAGSATAGAVQGASEAPATSGDTAGTPSPSGAGTPGGNTDISGGADTSSGGVGGAAGAGSVAGTGTSTGIGAAAGGGPAPSESGRTAGGVAAGTATGGTPGPDPKDPATAPASAANGSPQGGQRWADAIDRANQSGQGASQAAQGARIDRVLDDEGDQP